MPVDRYVKRDHRADDERGEPERRIGAADYLNARPELKRAAS